MAVVFLSPEKTTKSRDKGVAKNTRKNKCLGFVLPGTDLERDLA